MSVRMLLAGVVAKKLVPEKKGWEHFEAETHRPEPAAGGVPGRCRCGRRACNGWPQAVRQTNLNVPVKPVPPPPITPAPKPMRRSP